MKLDIFSNINIIFAPDQIIHRSLKCGKILKFNTSGKVKHFYLFDTHIFFRIFFVKYRYGMTISQNNQRSILHTQKFSFVISFKYNITYYNTDNSAFKQFCFMPINIHCVFFKFIVHFIQGRKLSKFFSQFTFKWYRLLKYLQIKIITIWKTYRSTNVWIGPTCTWKDCSHQSRLCWIDTIIDIQVRIPNSNHRRRQYLTTGPLIHTIDTLCMLPGLWRSMAYAMSFKCDFNAVFNLQTV